MNKTEGISRVVTIASSKIIEFGEKSEAYNYMYIVYLCDQEIQLFEKSLSAGFVLRI